MRAYKGFQKLEDGTLICRDMVYEPNRKYVFEGEIELCRCGYHACYELLDVWMYYPNNGTNAFYEVEYGGSIIESKNGSKFVCSEIELLREIDVSNVRKFEECYSSDDGIDVVVLENGKCMYIKSDGSDLNGVEYDYTSGFHEGLAWVRLENGKRKYIKKDGSDLNGVEYNDCGHFQEGLAWVRLENGKYKYITSNGSDLTGVEYCSCGYFSDGIAWVKLENKKYMRIKSDGAYIDGVEYDDPLIGNYMRNIRIELK